jgi:hypothetical protein
MDDRDASQRRPSPWLTSLPSPHLDVYFVHIDVDIVESFLSEVS